jgi:hypothetical protein
MGITDRLLPPPPRDSNKHKRKMEDIVADLSIQSEKEAIAICHFVPINLILSW